MVAKNSISIDEMADVIDKELAGYTRDVADEVKKAVDLTAKELLKNTRADAPKRTGEYKKAMAIKTRYEGLYDKRVTWYVKAPHYRLAHLLEKGHAKRGGGRVKAYPHIEKNEAKANADLERRVKEAIENAGK